MKLILSLGQMSTVRKLPTLQNSRESLQLSIVINMLRRSRISRRDFLSATQTSSERLIVDIYEHLRHCGDVVLRVVIFIYQVTKAGITKEKKCLLLTLRQKPWDSKILEMVYR